MSVLDMPLFGEPLPQSGPVTWVLTKKDKEDALRPRFVRYHGPAVPCGEQSTDPRDRCRPVTWLRSIGTKETPVCSRHKQDFLDRQILDTPRGSQ